MRNAIALLIGVVLGASLSHADAPQGLRNLPAVTEKAGRFAVTDVTWPANIGDAEVCLWRDDKVAAVSITIDDNIAPDHDWWLAAGEKYKFPFTWFVITGRVESGNAFFGKWDSFARLLKAGHDVQSHTYDHFNPFKGGVLPTEENYARAIADIEASLAGHKVSALAYPGGKDAKNDPAIAARLYVAARGTRGQINPANAIDYLNVGSISGPPLLDADHFAGLPNILTKNPKRPAVYRGWACMHMHGLTNTKDPTKNVDARMTEVLDYLAANRDKVWVGKFSDVAKYGQSRDTARITSAVDATGIRITLTDQMDDTLFDAPLTVKVRVEPSWKQLTAKQGESSVEAVRIDHEGAAYALMQVVPDRGEVVLTGK